MNASPLEPSSPEMLAEIIRQAEARLDAQLSAGIAADQRAMTFASLLLATAVVLFGAAIASALPTRQVAFILIVGVGLTVAAVMAIWSAQPSDWDYVGNVPSQWYGDVAEGKTLHSARVETAIWYDEMIAGNEIAIASAATLMRWAIRVAVWTTALAAVASAIIVAVNL